MSIEKLHRNLGTVNHSVIAPKRLAKLLNYDQKEMKKDLRCLYLFTGEPLYLDARTAENARHLLSVVSRYAEDEKTMKEVAVWTNYDSADELLEDANFVKFSADEFLRTVRFDSGNNGMSLS